MTVEGDLFLHFNSFGDNTPIHAFWPVIPTLFSGTFLGNWKRSPFFFPTSPPFYIHR